MQKKLTSHFINGDKKTNFVEKIIYTIFFSFEMIFEKKMTGYSFNEKNYNGFLNFYNYDEKKIQSKRPARLLSEFYIYEYLNKNYKKNDNLKVLDIGCGDGRFYEVLQKYFDNINYLGIDARPYDKWNTLKSDKVSFKSINLNKTDFNFLNDYKHFDLIFSQSALEHIKNDLDVLKTLSQKYSSARNLHIAPSAMSFLNYLTHGYRRYNYKDLNRLSKLINKDVKITKLGGYSAIKAYFNYYYDFKVKIDKKRKHPFNFLMYQNVNFDENLIKKFIFDSKKSFPLFYSIEY